MSRVIALISKAILKIVMDFSSLFVGLNWPDVREARAGVRDSRKGREWALRGAKLHKRQRGSEQPWMLTHHRLDRVHVQGNRQTDEGLGDQRDNRLAL
jgi:hypothetical protein